MFRVGGARINRPLTDRALPSRTASASRQALPDAALVETASTTLTDWCLRHRFEPMESRSLGTTGLRVSALGFGCGSVGGLMVRGEPGEQRAAVQRALEAGVTYFDTAPSYGDGRSEANLGRVLRALDAWSLVVVGTKVRLGRDDLAHPTTAVRKSVTASLDRLRRDSVDLLQLHSRILEDEERGITAREAKSAVAEAMREVVSEGLAKHVGITGLGDTQAVLDVVRSGRYDTVQAYFNALNPSAGYAGASAGAQDFAGLINEAASASMGVIAIRVLAAGAVSGSAERAENAAPVGGGALAAGGDFQADLERARALARLTRDLGLESTTELSLRFCLYKQGVSTALVGFSEISQLEDALRWAERGPLPPDAVELIVVAAQPEEHT